MLSARKLSLILQAIPRLGVRNVLRVGAYRVLSRGGYYRFRLPRRVRYAGPFFEVLEWSDRPGVDARAERVLSGFLPFFGQEWRSVGFPPEWIPSGQGANAHWSSIDEFSRDDIKEIWEPSRFAGLQILAQAAALTGERRYGQACEEWLSSWVAANPANSGPNWKCAQETALRLLAAILSADMLERNGRMRPLAPFERFVREHGRRIAPTMYYATAQDNNHATSEAAGLFVAGAYLLAHGLEDRESRQWMADGNARIESLVQRLVMPDGSFSQHSVTYHRLMLDTIAAAEIWRRRVGSDQWAPSTQDRLDKAIHWLESMTDPVTGDAPNLGANDGAQFFAFEATPYRDFRPSIDLSARLFLGRRSRYPPVAGDLATALGAPKAEEDRPMSLPRLEIFPEGGYAVWSSERCKVLLRLPVFRFRPSQSDLLHLDLWWEGVNLLRDGGSYSYNTSAERYDYFSGVRSHNTIRFDGQNQMPRLGRFLWGAWPRGEWTREDRTVAATYDDWRGCRHARRVRVSEEWLEIEDEVDGFTTEAILRWRLPAGSYEIGCGEVRGATFHLSVSGGDGPLDVSEGEESRHYQESESVFVIEARRRTRGRFTTRIHLKRDAI